MAEIWLTGRGGSRQKVTKIIALHEDVQKKLTEVTAKGAYKAEALLIKNRSSGDSQIETETGDVDHYVVLTDERGLNAALSIEYGRAATGYDIDTGEEFGAMAGLFILHEAMGLPKRRGLVPKGGADFE